MIHLQCVVSSVDLHGMAGCKGLCHFLVRNNSVATANDLPLPRPVLDVGFRKTGATSEPQRSFKKKQVSIYCFQKFEYILSKEILLLIFF